MFHAKTMYHPESHYQIYALLIRIVQFKNQKKEQFFSVHSHNSLSRKITFKINTYKEKK